MYCVDCINSTFLSTLPLLLINACVDDVFVYDDIDVDEHVARRSLILLFFLFSSFVSIPLNFYILYYTIDNTSIPRYDILMKTGNKEANLERLNDNPYRLCRLIMFPQMSQAQFVDTVVPGQLSRQMLRNVELGLPTLPPENLTFILSHHSSTSLYYQDPDSLLRDYQAFQLKTRQETGEIFGDAHYADPDFRYLKGITIKPRTLSTMHHYNITALAAKLCYPLQPLQRLNHDTRPGAVGDTFARVLRDLGYTEGWITQLAKNHEIALEMYKSAKKIDWSFN